MTSGLRAALRGARKIEWLILVVAVSAAILLAAGGKEAVPAGETELEQRLSSALSTIDGAGKVRVMVTEDASGGVVGVLAVAEGAESVRVELEILRAVTTLLDLETDRVEISLMRRNEK